jgi:hypothetical protein
MPMTPEMRSYEDRLSSDDALIAILGKFEPPGTKAFRYAMIMRER